MRDVLIHDYMGVNLMTVWTDDHFSADPDYSWDEYLLS